MPNVAPVSYTFLQITMKPYVPVKTTSNAKRPPGYRQRMQTFDKVPVTTGKRSASRNLTCIVAIRGADYSIASVKQRRTGGYTTVVP